MKLHILLYYTFFSKALNNKNFQNISNKYPRSSQVKAHIKNKTICSLIKYSNDICPHSASEPSEDPSECETSCNNESEEFCNFTTREK